MTRRRLTILAGIAAVIVVVALAVSPFLHHDHTTPANPFTDSRHASPSVTRQVTTLATVAATRALACQPASATRPLASSRNRRGRCGRFTATRLETDCRAQNSCQVEAIGTFTAPDTSTVISLTVAVQRDGDLWRVIGVSS